MKTGFGVVGTGMIARAISGSIGLSDRGRLAAISSRRQASADAFASEVGADRGVEGVDALLGLDEIEAVYIATPTSAKLEIAEACLRAGRHVLIDKPLPRAAEYERLMSLARERSLVLLDATHFVHHPRTLRVQREMRELIGEPMSIATAFCFPFAERSDIRFDPNQEPTGAVGDLAWYCLRATLEYLFPDGPPESEPSRIEAAAERDGDGGAVIRVSGLIEFDDGKTSTFQAGFTAGAVMMDLTLFGTTGVLSMDDFVLDWHNSFAFQDQDARLGFTVRRGEATRSGYRFVETPIEKRADVVMIDELCRLCADGTAAERERWMARSLATQRLVDSVFAAVS